MQIIRRIFATILVFLPFTKGFASEIKDEVAVGFNTYFDNGDVQVYSPTFEFLKKLTQKFFLGIKTRIDAISSASIRNGGRTYLVDTVTGASPRNTFDDVRYAGSLYGGYEGESFSITLGGYYSIENDYEGRSIFGNFVKQFNEQNTILGIGFSQSFDRWFPVFKRNLPKDYRRERKIDVSLTQLLSPTSMVQFIYTDLYSNGYLASPYHFIISDYISKFERYPDIRKGYALTFKLVKLLTERLATNLSYRYYKDDWDIKSHTFNIELLRDFTENLVLGIRYRYYTQTKAYFSKPIQQYKLNDKYYAIDYRMSEFSSNTLGVSFIYKPEGKFILNWDNIKLEGSIDYYLTSSNEYIKVWYGQNRLYAIFTSFLMKYEF